MRNIFLALLVVCLLSGIAFAGERHELTCDNGFWSAVANECISFEERRNEVGAGVDVILYEGEEGEILNKVTGEYKYDWQNGEHKAYAVATTKLSDIWAKIKGIFKKEEE